MNPRKITQLLKDHGFVLFKNGSKHALWKKGAAIIPVSYGTKTSYRSYLGTLQTLKKMGGAMNFWRGFSGFFDSEGMGRACGFSVCYIVAVVKEWGKMYDILIAAKSEAIK